jgi:hypothetical protein
VDDNVSVRPLPSFRRLRSLSPADWLAFGQAWLLLLAADLALRLLPYRRVDRLFSSRRTAGSRESAAERVAARAAWATRAAAGRHLWPMRCLPQSLCLRWLLARRGLPAVLRLGVAREGDALAAHAWVELAGRPVGEAEESVAGFAQLRGL